MYRVFYCQISLPVDSAPVLKIRIGLTWREILIRPAVCFHRNHIRPAIVYQTAQVDHKRGIPALMCQDLLSVQIDFRLLHHCLKCEKEFFSFHFRIYRKFFPIPADPKICIFVVRIIKVCRVRQIDINPAAVVKFPLVRAGCIAFAVAPVRIKINDLPPVLRDSLCLHVRIASALSGCKYRPASAGQYGKGCHARSHTERRRPFSASFSHPISSFSSDFGSCPKKTLSLISLY